MIKSKFNDEPVDLLEIVENERFLIQNVSKIQKVGLKKKLVKVGKKCVN